MYTHVSKCKNDKIKEREKKIPQTREKTSLPDTTFGG
jgi:hypothetical protein